MYVIEKHLVTLIVGSGSPCHCYFGQHLVTLIFGSGSPYQKYFGLTSRTPELCDSVMRWAQVPLYYVSGARTVYVDSMTLGGYNSGSGAVAAVAASAMSMTVASVAVSPMSMCSSGPGLGSGAVAAVARQPFRASANGQLRAR